MLLSIDFETTGVDPLTCEVIEIGTVLVDREDWRLADAESCLVQCKEIPPEVEQLTGITTDLTRTHGVSLAEAKERLAARCAGLDYILAHNANTFDRIIFERVFPEADRYLQKSGAIWIDTITDLPFPETITTRNLRHLAAEHGFLNPFSHRALFDAMTALKLFSAYPFEEVLKLAQSPTVEIRAVVSYDDRELAKARRYGWDAGRKWWVKQVKECNLEAERAAEFEVRVVSAQKDYLAQSV